MLGFKNARSHLRFLGFAIVALVVFGATFAIVGSNFSWLPIFLILVCFTVLPSVFIYNNHRKHVGHTSIEIQKSEVVVKDHAGGILFSVHKDEPVEVVFVSSQLAGFKLPASELSYLILKLPSGQEFYCSSFHGVDLLDVWTITTHKEHVLPLIGRGNGLEW